MVEGRVTVRDDHFGEGHPVRDIADGATVVERHLVDDRAFAIVETEPHRPVLPLELGALDGERRAFGLRDAQRLEVSAHLGASYRGDVLAVHRRVPVVVVILDLEQFERIHVDDELQTGDRVRERVPVRRLPSPEVAPAEPPLPVLLRHDRLAVGPHVDEDQAHVGEPAGRQLGDHVGVLAHRDVDIVEFVECEVRCDVGDVLEGHDRVAGQVDGGFVGLVVLTVEHDCERCPPHRIPRAPRLDLAFRRLLEFDGREPERVPDEPFPTQDGGGLPELVCRQRLQRVLRHVRGASLPVDTGRSRTPMFGYATISQGGRLSDGLSSISKIFGSRR